METDNFSYLDKCLNILLLEDDSHYQDLILEFMEPAKIFSFCKASSTAEALKYLNEKKRVHVCILDLGISDYAGDEFFILRNYAGNFPCIILTGSQSPGKGAACIQLGAKAVLEKGTDFKFEDLYSSICEQVLRGILNRKSVKKSTDTLNASIDILLQKKPSTVTQWADHLLITDRQMRNLWHNETGISAKHILEFHILLAQAFRYYKHLLFGNSERQEQNTGRSHSFFINHKKEIEHILNS